MAARKSAAAQPAAPQWDLGDLYPAQDSPALLRDLSRAEQLCTQFRREFEGKVETLSAESLARAIAAYETIQDLLGKVGSYAYLRFAKQQNDPAVGQFFQNMQEKLTEYSSQVLFFTLAINKIDDAPMEALLKHGGLRQYAPWLRDVRAFRPYQLSDELELLLHEKQVAGRAA